MDVDERSKKLEITFESCMEDILLQRINAMRAFTGKLVWKANIHASLESMPMGLAKLCLTLSNLFRTRERSFDF